MTSQSTELFGKHVSVITVTSLVALLTYLHTNVTKMRNIRSVYMRGGIYSEIDSVILAHFSNHNSVFRKGVACKVVSLTWRPRRQSAW